jgi:exonuclease SbcC
MRLHHLELTAFGPYAGTESIDFDELGADGLFLLHGETGAGKTTVLDAVAYALFGTVPGARGEVRRLRCDVADAGTPTSVRLELTVRDHRLLITRSPEYERPKRRGTGTTKQPATGSLVWLETLGEPPNDGSTRLDEIGRTVSGLLGMSAEQFFQVVLLPQGEFSRFLRADTAEREQLLEKLFGTQRFADVERWFRDRRAAKRAELDEARARSRDLIARVAQVVGLDEADNAGPKWLAAQLERAAEGVAAAATAEATARSHAATVRQELDGARARVQRVLRVRRAHAELASLESGKQRRTAMTAEVAAATAAAPVLRAQQVLTDGQRRVRAAEEAVRRVKASVTTTVTTDDAGELRAVSGSMRQQAGELGTLVLEAHEQARDRAQSERSAAELMALTEEREQRRVKLAELPESIARARVESDEAGRARSLLEPALARRDQLRESLTDACRVPELELEVESARQAHADRVDAHQSAREEMLELRSARLAGMAAELAYNLTDGEPCVVCGSTAHPAPAGNELLLVSEATERAAAEREQRAAAARDIAATRLHEARATLTSLTTHLGEATEAGLRRQLAAAETELRAFRAAAEAFDTLAERLSTLQARETELRERSAEADERAAVVRTELSAVTAKVRDREERLAQARGEFPDVAARRQHLLDQAAAVEALADAQAELLVREGARYEQQAIVSKEAANAGFREVADALAAARDVTALAALEAELERSNTRETAARAVLAEDELAGVAPDEDTDVSTVEANWRAASESSETAVSALRAQQHREQELTVLADRLRRRWRETAPIEKAFAELDALTDVINGRGQNHQRMSLRAFVLAARLEEVADAATKRLGQMSEGRYSFVHTVAAGARGTRGGLALDVLDDYSGQARPAKTLSGGESFLASLSLALGLADVVSAEAAGAQIDTLFVDEGFGTLDAATLEEVMGTLDELRAGGRVVGLVSHVDELRQRIPMQLRVRKARTGSTLEFVNS